MKRLQKGFIIPLLIIIILSIVGVFIFYYSNNNSQTTINDRETTTNASTTSETVGINYDGTYTGTFNYEYQDVNRFNSKEIITPWTTGSFNLTITLKSLNKPSPADTDPYINLDAFNVIVSDPGFNTGSGVDAVSSFGSQISVSLPADPAKQDSEHASIYLYIPSSDYSTRFIETSGDGIDVSPDGKTIYLNPNFESSYNTNKNRMIPAWKANTSTLCPETTFCKAGAYKNIVFDRYFKYGSWSLTKTSN